MICRLGALTALGLAACRHREAAPGATSEAVLTARTLGLAYLQSDQLAPAESAFRRVIELAPDQALGHANLGLVLLRQGRYRDAEAEIRRAARLDSTSDDVALMLAKVYRLTDRASDAREEIDHVLGRSPGNLRALFALAQLVSAQREGSLRQIVERAPANMAGRLQLVDVLLARGASDDAVAQLEALRQQLPALPREARPYFERALSQARAGHAHEAGAAAATFHHFMETTPDYQADLHQLQGASGALVGTPVLTFNPNLTPPALDARTIAATIRFTDVTEAAGLTGIEADSQAEALAVGDYDGDGSPDAFIGGHLFENALGHSMETTERAGIRLQGRAVAAAFGDYDNDGHLDLFVATAAGGVLLHNEGDSTFRDVTAAAGLDAVPPAVTARFLDLDHDGDLDLLLASASGNKVYRNTLDGPFQDMTAAMGLAGLPGGRDAAFADFDGDGRTDLVFVGDDGRLTLYRNLGQGHFQDATAASGLAEVTTAAAVAVGDYDNDGFQDLFVASGSGGTSASAPALYRNRGDGAFELDRRASAALRILRRVDARSALFCDVDNDGYLDLVVAGRPKGGRGVAAGRGVFLLRNDEQGRFEDRSSILLDAPASARRVAALDYDRDGDLDLLLLGWDGRPHLLLNDGGNANQYVQVRLTALRAGSGKNNDFGVGSTLELRAGKLYQTRVVTGQVTHFGLGRHIKADVLRVRWPNGVSQTVYYPGTDEDVLEKQILKGSCPFLYAWNGQRFEFVTDVMWRSALGMPLGIMGSAGAIAAASPHSSREYMRIPGRALTARDGRYTLQLTEELWETAYLDRLRLLVVDHPDSVDVFVNERFVPPTAAAPGGPPPPRLYQVAHRRAPVRATDEAGRDLLPLLRDRDDAYVAGFTPARYQGLTAMHDLVLDFGDLTGMDSVYLFLTGWIYPTDASINLALAQDSTPSVVAPFLQVPDPRAGWRTVVPDLGFPAGKNKTVIVDLTGKLPASDHRVRIRTNMEVYWDQAFVAATAATSPVTITVLDPEGADLHYRGFSRTYRKGGRYGPQWFDYAHVSTEPRWAPILGAFTRYGDVRPLLDSADDRYVIFGPGDEITLSFDATAAPALERGWTRDYLIYTDAWMKDADLNTADGGTVGPLPFHGMSRYPYGPDEAYPSDEAHERYLQTYNVRRTGK